VKLLDGDVARWIRAVPCLRLGKEGSGARYIATLARDALELERILTQYPDVRYEPLDAARIRRAPDPRQLESLQREMAAVRSAYESEGSGRAFEVLRKCSTLALFS
jgi:hypothetical protein